MAFIKEASSRALLQEAEGLRLPAQRRAQQALQRTDEVLLRPRHLLAEVEVLPQEEEEPRGKLSHRNPLERGPREHIGAALPLLRPLFAGEDLLQVFHRELQQLARHVFALVRVLLGILSFRTSTAVTCTWISQSSSYRWMVLSRPSMNCLWPPSAFKQVAERKKNGIKGARPAKSLQSLTRSHHFGSHPVPDAILCGHAEALEVCTLFEPACALRYLPFSRSHVVTSIFAMLPLQQTAPLQ